MSWQKKSGGMLDFLHILYFHGQAEGFKVTAIYSRTHILKPLTTPKPFLTTKAASFIFFFTLLLQDQTCNQNNVFWWVSPPIPPYNTWNYRLGLEQVPGGWSSPRLFSRPLTWSFWLTLGGSRETDAEKKKKKLCSCAERQSFHSINASVDLNGFHWCSANALAQAQKSVRWIKSTDLIWEQLNNNVLKCRRLHQQEVEVLALCQAVVDTDISGITFFSLSVWKSFLLPTYQVHGYNQDWST